MRFCELIVLGYLHGEASFWYPIHDYNRKDILARVRVQWRYSGQFT
jgi:hypothetical protein